MSEEKRISARWVGSISLGLTLIATGLVGLGCYFIPGFDGWLACRLSPLMLVVLGGEVIYGAGRGRPFRLGSAVCCLLVMGSCALLNLGYACYAAGWVHL